MSAPAVQLFLTPTSSREEARHKARLLVREGLRRWGLPYLFIHIGKDATGRPCIVPPASCTPRESSFPSGLQPSLQPDALPLSSSIPPDISFSHAPGSPGLTAVALGLGCRVGVDVEPLSTHFPPPMCARIFSAAEMAHPLADPVRLWTRKEALLKADGRGLSMDLAQLDVLEDWVELEGAAWRLHQVDAGPDYVCCVATGALSRAAAGMRVAVAVEVLHRATLEAV